MSTNQMLEELDRWCSDPKFPSSKESTDSVRKVLDTVKAKPQRIGPTGGGGMMMRWDSPLYVFKLRIPISGKLDDDVLRAIDILPEDHSGPYGAGGGQGD